MEISLATLKKVAFCIVSIVFMLATLALSQQPAQAYPGVADNKPITADGKAFYVVRGPQLFRIKDQSTLDTCFGGAPSAQRLDPLQLFFVAVSLRHMGPIECPLGFPEGLILWGGEGTAKYRFIQNKLRPLDSYSHNYCLGGPTNIRELSSYDYQRALQIFAIDQPYKCSRIEYPDGTLLQASGPGVYLLKNGLAYGMPNPQVLSCYGGWSKVKKVSDAEFGHFEYSYPAGGPAICPISIAEGGKVLAPNGTVYILRGGRLFGMPNPQVLTACFGGWSNIRRLSEAETAAALATYPSGGVASCIQTLPERAKFRNAAGTVYVVLAGKVSGVPSPAVLTSCFGGWSNISVVSDAEVTAAYAYYGDGGLAGCNAPPPPAGLSTREARAIEWARSLLGGTGYIGYCEKMVENAFGTTGKEASALSNANKLSAAGAMHAGDTNVPAGKLAFFGSAKVNGGYGHVMLSIGGGQFITNGYIYNGQVVGAHVTGLSATAFGPYIGWADAPASWPGR